MKNMLIVLKTLFFLFLLSSCVGQVSKPIEDREDFRNKGPSRFDDLRERERDSKAEERIRERFSGTACEDLKDDKRRRQTLECEDMCRDVYGGRDSDECEELSEEAIEKIHELHEMLERPDYDDLAGIEDVVFENYLDISIRPFGRLIEDYSQNQAEETLIWVLSDLKIFDVFESDDDDFELLDELLEQFNNGSIDSAELPNLFSERIDNEGSLVEYLMEVGDDNAFNYLFFEYVENISNPCERDRESKACFEVYCKIGNDLDDDVRSDMISNFDTFYDYLDEIIDDKINSRQGTGSDKNTSGWIFGDGNNEIDEVEDVDDDRNNKTWVDRLCQGLT
ncbi:MAG: hypothetical protein GDA46_06875 [Bdellovibrionales bacterium]|nr:hypothetical protein [Bdellovibrionales bacterium]